MTKEERQGKIVTIDFNRRGKRRRQLYAGLQNLAFDHWHRRSNISDVVYKIVDEYLKEVCEGKRSLSGNHASHVKKAMKDEGARTVLLLPGKNYRG